MGAWYRGEINKWWLLKDTILIIASFMRNHHVFVDVIRGLSDEMA
jgi:hypothetical protein